MQRPFPLEFAIEARDGAAAPTLAQRTVAWLATPAAMVLVGLAARLIVAALAHSYRTDPSLDHFDFGYETGRVARSLAEGNGFSSPFHGQTGPTAWLAPLYPALAAVVFRVFGVYTQASAATLLAFNSVCSALTCWTIYGIAKEIAGERVARWSGWTWALLPHAMYWSSRWIWETSLATLLLTAALLLALRLEREARLRDWVLFGLCWGGIALTNPACLTLLAVYGLWIAFRLGRRREAWLAGAALSAVIFCAMLAPWTVRNYRVFGQVVPIRDNFGVEFWLGNSDYSEGLWMMSLHPSQDMAQMQQYTRMGELNYVRAKKQEAMTFVREHPARFAFLCVRRAAWFWVGTPRSSERPLLAETRNSSIVLFSALGIWGAVLMVLRRRRGAWLIALSLAIYPAVYYLTFIDARYRHPIEPMMMVAGFYLVFAAMPQRLRLVRPRPEPEIERERLVA